MDIYTGEAQQPANSKSFKIAENFSSETNLRTTTSHTTDKLIKVYLTLTPEHI